jgi:hypothetical protein
MKALNRTRNVTLKYPRDTPRISRKRLWYDRSEWRQDPQATMEGSLGLVDNAMEKARNTPDLGQTNHQDFPDLMNRAARVGLNKL